MADAITDAMIEAGVEAYIDTPDFLDDAALVEAIYLAMQAARQPPSQVPAEDVERVAQAIALVYNADAGSTAHDVVEIDRKAARAALTALQVTEGDKS
jgi:hypothetical protein